MTNAAEKNVCRVLWAQRKEEPLVELGEWPGLWDELPPARAEALSPEGGRVVGLQLAAWARSVSRDSAT